MAGRRSVQRADPQMPDLQQRDAVIVRGLHHRCHRNLGLHVSDVHCSFINIFWHHRRTPEAQLQHMFIYEAVSSVCSFILARVRVYPSLLTVSSCVPGRRRRPLSLVELGSSWLALGRFSGIDIRNSYNSLALLFLYIHSYRFPPLQIRFRISQRGPVGGTVFIL